MERKRIKKADILLLAGLLLLGLVFGGIMLLGAGDGGRVRIVIDGEVTEEYPLSEDLDRVIRTEGGMNHLIIKDAEVYLTEADCPDRLCMGMGKISKKGQSVICLPHKLAIEIVGDAPEDDSVDVIVGQ